MTIAKTNENKLGALKGIYVGTFFGPKKNEGEFEVRTNGESTRLYEEANIISIM